MVSLGRIPPKKRTAEDLSDEEMEELIRLAEEQAAKGKVLEPATEAVVEEPELTRSTLVPLGKDKEGNVVPALPTVVTGPVEAWKRFVDSAKGQDFSQGVPDVTDQQIKDAFVVGGTANLPSLVKAPVENTLMANPFAAIPQKIKQQMRFTKAPAPPTIRKVIEVTKDAPKDLETLETAKDLYKAYILDEKTALSDIAERAGVPNLKAIKTTIDQDTQTTALMRVNESLKTGKLRTFAGDFNAPIPPEGLYMKYKALPALTQKDADDFLKLNDLTDDMRLRLAQGIDPANSQQILNDALNNIALIRQRSPIVDELHKEYKGVTEAVRNFLGTGKNSMLDQKALAKLGQERPNYVPIDVHGINPNDPLASRVVDAQRLLSKSEMDDWFLQRRDLKNINNIDGRTDAFETLLSYTRNALQNKMENDVRGQYADGIMNSAFGANTMRELKPDEAGKYGNRVVEIYENGEKKKYVASRLQADLLRFDPHIAKFPAFYSLKRFFEMGTTGALGLTFAPVTMMRDAITGNVVAPRGVGTPGILRTLAEVPRSVAAKTALASSLLLKYSFKDVPFLTQQAKDQLATSLGAAYSNSLEAMANKVGGIDANLMKSTIDARKGVVNEVKRSLEASAGKVPGANFLGRSARVLWDGWEGLFSSVSDAPRMAAFRQSIKKGLTPEDAAIQARATAGDTTRSGRVYKPDGTRVDADAVNKSALVPAAAVGKATQFAREAIPYVNPTIQGLRRVGTRFLQDPVRTTLRAWQYVGLPAVAAYGWNEMLGPEYNDYANKQRSSRDQAMNIYVAVPGLPPEQGIELPIAQEMMPWNAPMVTALYNMGRGDQDVSEAVKHMAGTILTNGAMLGYPVGFSQAFQAAGMRPPESILTPWADVYEMREDNVGFLPQNVEAIVRQTFGGISDLVMQSAAAGWEGGPEAFAKEFGNQWVKRVPIAKNLAGTKTATSNFTPLSMERQRKFEALDKFLDAYDEHFNPKKEGRLSTNNLSELPEGTDVNDETTYKLAPPTSPVPTNPIFKQFGDVVKAYIGTNDEGMTGLKSHYSNLTKQLQLLKGYSAGSAGNFKEYQKSIVGATEKYNSAIQELQSKQKAMKKPDYNREMKNIELNLGERAKAEQLLEKLDIDLGNRNDVHKLINYLEKDRTQVIDEQLVLIRKLEDYMTQQLHSNGMLPPTQRFDVERHLTPLMPSDFKTPSAVK